MNVNANKLKLINLLLKNKTRLLMLSWLFFVFFLISLTMILIGSIWVNTKAMTLIGLIILITSYFGLLFDLSLIYFMRETFFDNWKKIQWVFVFSIISLPITIFLSWLTIVLLKYIEGYNAHLFTKTYFYIYFFPILIISINGIYNYFKIRKTYTNNQEVKLNNQEVKI